MTVGQALRRPRVLAGVLLLACLTGCVSQTPGPTASDPAADLPAAGSAAPGSQRPVESSAQAAAPAETMAPSAKPSEAAEPSASPSQISAKENKAPKTWPKTSRASEASENAATDGFIGKTEQMTSPNFEKKLLDPQTAFPSPPDYSGIAIGAALGELEAQFTEYARNNWKQTGEVSIVGEPKVEDLLIDDVLTHRVYLCLDSSSIEVTEPDGFVVTAAEKSGTRTALNIYDLQEHEGQLLVADHLFPEDPNC